MPISKHGRKGLTSRQWRKRRNYQRANEQERALQEKRGMKKAMNLMREQYESEKEILEEEEGNK
ncbi:hypothetical protein CMI37_13505 [Candidatus Pacearchaeota archaeon]|nr:hypothetical protein [Candidatus Pacearchaeota archaeon]|tara:strand:+ start:1648 stop:1839 length:192 start_codon:yes stop_codon:yes gene_type:complete